MKSLPVENNDVSNVECVGQKEGNGITSDRAMRHPRLAGDKGPNINLLNIVDPVVDE